MKPIVGLISSLFLWACGPPSELPDRDSIASIASTSASGIEIHAVRVGWVRVTNTHREARSFLATPRVFLDPGWSDWMPNIVYVIRHPEKTILVDTGASLDINDEDYFGCSSGAFFYENRIEFSIEKDNALAAHLSRLKIDPLNVDTVVITHFHADHVGNLDLFPNSTMLSGPGNWPNHVGSFTCHLPKSFSFTAATFSDGTKFAPAQYLTQDRRVKVVPLPGHTDGHVGVLVDTARQNFAIVGDATFDMDQTDRNAVSGISEHFNNARASQKRLKLLKDDGYILLPTHDPTVFSRLKKWEAE